MSEKNTMGMRIAGARRDNGLSQEDVAERLGVTFQAVSLWERDQAFPGMEHLKQLAELLGVSVSYITEDKTGQVFTTRKNLFDWDHMTTFVKHAAKANKMVNTAKALPFAIDAHKGQLRKSSDVPYIYHPLNLACHALAMGIHDDATVAACLLHDTVEDCGISYDQLPVNDETKELVKLLTHGKKPYDYEAYFNAIAENSKASLVKCLDRCNNITTMAWGFGREKICDYIRETEQYFPKLLDVLKKEPAFNDAAWLLRYQMESMLDIYKRLV